MEGIAQVVKSLQTEEAVSSQMLITQMAQAVARFVGEAEQSDDLTMLAIGYRPGK